MNTAIHTAALAFCLLAAFPLSAQDFAGSGQINTIPFESIPEDTGLTSCNASGYGWVGSSSNFADTFAYRCVR